MMTFFEIIRLLFFCYIDSIFFLYGTLNAGDLRILGVYFY
jgi:hypothetical protein